MEPYIKKAAIVAEIDSWRDGIKKGIFSIPLTGSDRAYATFEYEILGKVKDLLDTLEVKEVDFEKEVADWWNAHYSSKAYTFEGYSGHYLENSTVINIAKHFFELGLKAQKGE